MVKISVIVPVYGVEKYIKKCMDSLVNQTFKDIEIICINDGSKDSSLSILEECQKIDNRIKIINQENKGLSGARNSGLDISTGEYYGFVESDDFISP
jgi:glycosyltransferase involved in cell wall biosynthesis